MNNNWEVNVNGKIHNVEFYRKKFKHYIIIDGQETMLKSRNKFVDFIDYEFNIEDTVCNLTLVGSKKANLAVNGVYLGTNEPYKPFDKIPVWVNVLGLISTFGGAILSGLISVFVGYFMFIAYLKLAINKKFGAIIGAFIGCTIFQVALMFFFSYLRLSLHI